MGGGSWSASTYAATTRSAIDHGTTFAYTSAVAAGTVAAAVHEDLDPKWTAGAASPYAGQIVRESRDNDEHPSSVPIAVFFDETGSMGNVPRVMQTKLAELFGLLLRKGYVTDPQLLVGAYGDAALGFEVAPLQVGQFESDNRADEDLDRIYLEGHGGGNGMETAAFAWWFIGRYAKTDAWEKRGKKGYLFTIGDEITDGVTRDMVQQYVTKDTDIEGKLTPKQVVAQVREQWNLYHLVINNYTAARQRSVEFYTDLLGKNAIVVENEDDVAEVIASIIGVEEGTVDLDEALDNLDEVGASGAKGTVRTALAKYTGGGGKVAVAETPGDLVSTGSSEAVDRL